MGLIPTKEERERAVLVTVEDVGPCEWSLEDRAEELRRLARTCGVKVVDECNCRVKSITPGLFVGSGKVVEIAEMVEEASAEVVIFDHDLSPSQQKNLEDMLKVRVVDRTQLILDIFARRANSNEGKVQVELAQLEYLLPRLSRMWMHLSKQRGGVGVGMKGPGEQQLEVDRRRVRERIGKLKRQLKDITGKRHTQRAQREKFSLLTIALVGYTNSGKSTFFNRFTSSETIARDQLFSTLDPTVRKKRLSNNQTVLISDTVGFLNELPHHLIESFKATLEEVIDADILFHIIDMSDEKMEQEKAAVMKVLEDLGIGDKPIITVLNKMDKVPDPMDRQRIKFRFDNPFMISALTGEGIEALEDRIIHMVERDMEDMDIVLPHKYCSLSSLIRENGTVRAEEYTDAGLRISARVPRKIKYTIFKIMQGR